MWRQVFNAIIACIESFWISYFLVPGDQQPFAKKMVLVMGVGFSYRVFAGICRRSFPGRYISRFGIWSRYRWHLLLYFKQVDECSTRKDLSKT